MRFILMIPLTMLVKISIYSLQLFLYIDISDYELMNNYLTIKIYTETKL